MTRATSAASTSCIALISETSVASASSRAAIALRMALTGRSRGLEGIEGVERLQELLRESALFTPRLKLRLAHVLAHRLGSTDEAEPRLSLPLGHHQLEQRAVRGRQDGLIIRLGEEQPKLGQAREAHAVRRALVDGERDLLLRREHVPIARESGRLLDGVCRRRDHVALVASVSLVVDVQR